MPDSSSDAPSTSSNPGLSSGDSTGGTRPANPSNASGGMGSTLGELEKVRNLLFGEHARETDQRLEHLEGRVEERLSSLRADLQSQIDGLDSFAREEQESLDDRLATQKKVHREDVNNLEREVQQLKRELADAREELNDTLDRTERSFRERVHQQEKDLSQQMADQHAELSSMIEAAVARLRGDATDRRALADLFEQVATRLRE